MVMLPSMAKKAMGMAEIRTNASTVAMLQRLSAVLRCGRAIVRETCTRSSWDSGKKAGTRIFFERSISFSLPPFRKLPINLRDLATRAAVRLRHPPPVSSRRRAACYPGGSTTLQHGPCCHGARGNRGVLHGSELS